MRRYLARHGWGRSTPSTTARRSASIEHFAEQLAVRRSNPCARPTGAARVLLICSQHGRAGRARVPAARRRGARRAAGHIGTPHHGSMLAWTFAGRCLAQMRPGNPWLADINRAESEPPPVPITSIWSRHDSLVAPQASAKLACARNIALAGIGHNAMLNHRDVMDEVAHARSRARRRPKDLRAPPGLSAGLAKADTAAPGKRARHRCEDRDDPSVRSGA